MVTMALISLLLFLLPLMCNEVRDDDENADENSHVIIKWSCLLAQVDVVILKV